MTPSPRVWCKFTVKNKDGILKLRVQDAPNDRMEDVIDIFVKYFIPEESCHKAAGIHKSKEAIAEAREFLTFMLNDIRKTPHNVLICCVNEDNDVIGEIVGASLTVPTMKDDPEDEDFDFKPKTKEFGNMFRNIDKLFSQYDVIKDRNVDSFLDGRGVVIQPKYRGLRITQYLLNARRQVCHVVGLPLTGAWVTSIGVQKAAERTGWETVHEVSYEVFEKEHGVTFENEPPTCKYMIAKPIPVD